MSKVLSMVAKKYQTIEIRCIDFNGSARSSMYNIVL